MNKDLNASQTSRLPLLLILLAAIILVPLAIVTLRNASFKSNSRASGCDIVAGCEYNGKCYGAGQQYEANNAYMCKGSNVWSAPDGTVALQPLAKGEDLLLQADLKIEQDSKAGCMFTLRYDSNETIDETLKKEAAAAASDLKTMLEKGIKGTDLLAQVLSGLPQSAVISGIQARLDATNNGLPVPTLIPNVYDKFKVSLAENFCFANSSERDSKLGQAFYKINPSFLATFQTLGVSQVTEPFTVSKMGSSGQMDYAWAIVYREL